MSNGSVVWIVNASSHDYTPVRDIEGVKDVRAITTGYVSLGNYNRLLETIRNSLIDSEPEDFLLLSGLPFLNVLAAVYFINRHGGLNLLTWDKKYKTYRKFKLTNEQLDFLENLNRAGDVHHEDD